MEKNLFDPETGEPIKVTAEEEADRFDPETGEPIRVSAEEEADRFDPETGMPIGLATEEEAEDRFDPETGMPIGVSAEEEPEDRFDPETGMPIGVATEEEAEDRFDPETGMPIGVIAEEEPEDRFDPETGMPIGAAAEEEADRFDPETGMPIGMSAKEEPEDRFDPETGKPIGGSAPLRKTSLKKPIKPLLIGAAGVCALVVGVSSVFGGLFKNKNDIVSNALTEIVNTMDEGYLEDTFGIKDLYKMASEGSVRMEVSVGADDIMGFYIPVEGKLAFSRDPSNSAVLLEAAAEAASMDLGTMSAYMDDKVIAVAAPEIIDEVFTLNYSDDLAKQLGNSELFDRINMEDKDIEFATSMIADTNRVLAGKEKRFKLKEIYDRYKKTTKAAERLKDAMEVEKAESRKLTINGKEKTYKGYKVRIPSKAIAEFVKTAGKFIATDEELKNKEFAYITQMMTAERMMEGYHYDEARDWAEDKMEMFLDELQSGSEEAEDMVREYLEDIDLLLYVDGKGHAVYLDAECTVDNMTLETEMTFHGGARPMAEMDGEVKLSAGGSRLRLKVERTEESTSDSFRSETTVRTNGNGANLKVAASMEYDKKRGDFEFSVRGSSGGMQFQAGIEGAVIDYKKGKSLAVDIDSVSVKAPYFSWSGDLGGHLSIEPLSGKLKAPEGKVFDVIAADEDDWKDVIDEIQSEIYDIESGLSY